MRTNRDRQSWTYRPRRGVRHDYAYRAPEPDRRPNRKRKHRTYKPLTIWDGIFILFVGIPAFAAIIAIILGAL